MQDECIDALQRIQRYIAVIACQSKVFKKVILLAAKRLTAPGADVNLVEKDLGKKWDNAVNETQKVGINIDGSISPGLLR